MQPNLATLLALGAGACAATASAAVAEGIMAAARQTVAIRGETGSAQLAFRGLTVAGLTPSADGMEVSIRFNEPVDEKVARELTRLVSSVGYASTGYDSLLLRVLAPSEFAVSEETHGFALQISPRKASADSARLAELEIRRRTLTGDTAGARELLIPLRTSRPDDTALLRLEASVDFADRNYWAAAEKYDQALKLSPGDIAAQRGLESALDQVAPRVEGSAETREIEGGDSQNRFWIGGETPVGRGLALRGRIEHVALDDNAVQAPDGSFQPFAGNHTMGEIGLSLDLENRWQVSASLHASAHDAGLGAGLGYRDASSSVEFSAGYRQPTWDYPETIVGNGTFDFIALTAARSIDETWLFSTAMALRRYALYGQDEAAIASSVEAGLRWTLPLGSPTKVTIGYGFDAEYSHDIALLDDGGGGFFALLPVGDRMIHTADIRVADQLAEQVFASAFTGYARDNEGVDGLVAGGELTYSPAPEIRLSLNVFYSGISDRLGESGDYLQAGLTVSRLFVTNSRAEDGE